MPFACCWGPPSGPDEAVCSMVLGPVMSWWRRSRLKIMVSAVQFCPSPPENTCKQAVAAFAVILTRVLSANICQHGSSGRRP